MSSYLSSDIRLFDLLDLCSNSRADEIEQYEALIGPWDADVAANGFWMTPGPRFGLYDSEGYAVVIGGWMPVIEGVYQSWMVGREGGWDDHWRSITKACRKVMDFMFDVHGARRLQTSALESRERACEWYHRGLRMNYEGCSVGFGRGGENMVNYALAKEIRNGK